MTAVREEQLKEAVKARYGAVAQEEGSCCGPAKGCCTTGVVGEISRKIGYTQEELAAVPEGANLGLGCGNPVALAALREGEVVLDLGSGAGFDAFLAAARVGEKGRVIGVDMTPQMVEKARENAQKGGYAHVEFRLGEIERLPVADESVDVVLSNCVINLVPDKERAFAEAFRTLKPGGRMMVSDIVLTGELPASIKDSVEAYTGCLSGAARREDYLRAIEQAGFRQVRIAEEKPFSADCIVADPTAREAAEGMSQQEVEEAVGAFASVRVFAVKPE